MGWYGLDLPTFLHAIAFTAWWLALLALAASIIRTLREPQRRLAWLGAGGATLAAAMFHLVGMRSWLLDVRPGLGFALLVGAGIGWIVLGLSAPSADDSVAEPTAM